MEQILAWLKPQFDWSGIINQTADPNDPGVH